MKLRQRLGQLGTVVIITAAGVVGTVSAASSADMPQFPVMNTSEQPPDGVWFRYGPDPSQTTRTTGVGVYRGEHVRVKCYTIGTPFGPYNNTIWYYAYDVERPTAAGRSNEGWINTHYVDDGMTANHAHPSVPSCNGGGGTPTPPSGGGSTPPPVAIYYSPYKASDPSKFKLVDQSAKTAYVNEWSTNCGSADPAYNKAQQLAAGRPIKTLSGWSKGRMGPIYYLSRATTAERKQVNYMLLIDPGAWGEMDCDRTKHAGDVLVQWLQQNPNAHLVVISSSEVSQQGNSRGIQETYFNAVRNASRVPYVNLRPRVLTCNYTFSHQQAFYSAQYWINHEIGSATSSCPWLNTGGQTFKPTAGWHP
ncbi:hypothetical protein [Amycolatopsis sp. cmx-4-68]|uniref:hypothetical protein n=1 Tax=Amycolatopsis sp. cmx-4-68 TaxID=2790938 RepID=UPI00397D1009